MRLRQAIKILRKLQFLKISRRAGVVVERHQESRQYQRYKRKLWGEYMEESQPLFWRDYL